MLHRIKETFRRRKVVFAERAYEKCGLPEWVQTVCRLVLQPVRRPFAAKGFVVLPKRWIVERTFARLGRSRRLSKDYERLTEHSEAMISIAMISLMSRRLAKAKS